MTRLTKKACLIGGSVMVALILITLITVIAVQSGGLEIKENKFDSKSKLGHFEKAAVASNGPECSHIGNMMLKRKGSAVDAAIATLLCEGVASFHSMGLGGGFLMTIYDSSDKSVAFLDARETAPALANETMYGGNASLSIFGGLSVAIPGELMGYWEAHKRYGKLPWRDLFQPAIQLCNIGSIVTKYLENSLKGKENFIRAEPTLAEILINPETDKLFSEGERIKRPVLAKTLRMLADSNDPVHLFYNGEIRNNLVDELSERNSIITRADFSNYKIKWKSPIEARVKGMLVYTAPPPGSGALLAFMLNVLEDLVPVEDEKVMYQRVIEAFKWAYAKRTELGDPDFVDIDMLVKNITSKAYADKIKARIEDDKTHEDPKYYGAQTTNKEDYGTAHVAVLAPDGSAVSVTSTINQVLGAKIRSRSTGLIFNDEMDDFSSPNITNGFDLPPSKNNFIRPFKRPLSSMTPTIVLDKDKNVNLVIGAAGGSKITTAIALIMILNLWDNYSIKEAIDAYRIHHQLFPMAIQNENGFPDKILKHLKKIGHNATIYSGIGSAVTAVQKRNGIVTANADYRRQGQVDGI